jgi:hypothetical protein
MLYVRLGMMGRNVGYVKPYSLPFVVAIFNTFFRIWACVVSCFCFPLTCATFLEFCVFTISRGHFEYLSSYFYFPENGLKPTGMAGLSCLRIDPSSLGICNEQCAGSDIIALCSIPAQGLHVWRRYSVLIWCGRRGVARFWTPSMSKHGNIPLAEETDARIWLRNQDY